MISKLTNSYLSFTVVDYSVTRTTARIQYLTKEIANLSPLIIFHLLMLNKLMDKVINRFLAKEIHNFPIYNFLFHDLQNIIEFATVTRFISSLYLVISITSSHPRGDKTPPLSILSDELSNMT